MLGRGNAMCGILITTITRVPLADDALPFCAAAARARRRTNGSVNLMGACSGARNFLAMSARPQNAMTIFGTHIASHANQ